MKISNSAAPCGICGGKVQENRVRGEMSIGDRTPPIEIERVCLNRECASNNGDTSLVDSV